MLDHQTKELTTNTKDSKNYSIKVRNSISLFTLIKLYSHKRGATEYCLNGLKIAIHKLNDFWQEQKNSFKEIKEISDEEVPVNF